MIDQAQQHIGLVIGRDGRERRAVTRAGGVGAGAEIVEAQDAEARGVERQSGTDDFVPPAATRLVGQPDATRCGDAAQCDHHGRVGGAGQPPGNGHRLQPAAEVQLELAGHGQHAFAHLQGAVLRSGCRLVGAGESCLAHRMLQYPSQHSNELPCWYTAPLPARTACRSWLICRIGLPEGESRSAGVGTFPCLRRLPRLRRAYSLSRSR